MNDSTKALDCGADYCVDPSNCVKHDKPDPEYHVGDRIVFLDITTERPGVIRGFQWADWSDEPLLMVDIDPPLRGASGVSNGRRIEQHRVVRKGRI